MKNNALIRIVLWSLTLAILVFMLAVGLLGASPLTGNRLLHFPFRFSDTDSDASGVTGSTFQAEASPSVRKVSVDWLSGTIEIRPDDVNTITVTETAPSDSRYAMYCRQDGSTLKIDCWKESLSLSAGKGHLEKDLLIRIPRNYPLDCLEISAASSDVIVTDLQISEAELDTASGVSRFVNCSVDELDLDTASGDLSFQGTLRSLDCDSASAKITAILENVPDSFDIDTASGDLELTLPENAGFTVKLDSLSGRIYSDFPVTNRNNQVISGDGRCRIEMDSMSGQIYIYKQK